MNRLTQEVGELRLVYVEVAADKDNNIFVRRVLLIHDRLAGFLKRGVQEFADLFDGVYIGCVFFPELVEIIVCRIFHNALRRLHVCAVVAL